MNFKFVCKTFLNYVAMKVELVSFTCCVQTMSMVNFYLWTDAGQNLTGRLGNYTLLLPHLPVGEVLGHLVRKTDTNYLENNNCKKYFMNSQWSWFGNFHSVL